MLLFILLYLCQPALADARTIVFLVGEEEYHTAQTLPEFASKELEPRGMRIVVINDGPQNKNNFPGLVEALSKADLLVLSVRRRFPPHEQLEAVRKYLDSGKPLVGIRTACHAFAPRGKIKPPPGGDAWPEFDPQVLGGHYDDHYKEGPKTVITLAPDAGSSPILKGIDVAKLTGNGSLYRVHPLDPSCHALLIGTIPNEPTEPIAWTHLYGPKHSRVFYTSLGHPQDFQEPQFRRLFVNAILWASEEPKPPAVQHP